VQAAYTKGYEGGITVGQRVLFNFSGSGPTSYSNVESNAGTGDVIVFPFGIYADNVVPCMSKSGNFVLFAFPSAIGTTRATWSFKWRNVSNFGEVANGTNLSAEQVDFTVLGGNF